MGIPKPWCDVFPGRALSKTNGQTTVQGHVSRYHSCTALKPEPLRRFVVKWANGLEEILDGNVIRPWLMDRFLDESWVLPDIRALQKAGWDMSKLPEEPTPVKVKRKRASGPTSKAAKASGKAGEGGGELPVKKRKTSSKGQAGDGGVPAGDPHTKAARGGRPPLSPAIKSPTKSSKRAPQKGNPEAGGLDAAPAAVAAAGPQAKAQGRPAGLEQAASPPPPDKSEEEMIHFEGFSVPKRLTLTEGDKLREEYQGMDFTGVDLPVEHLCAERGKGKQRKFLPKFQGFELEPNDWLPYKALKHNEALARWEQARK